MCDLYHKLDQTNLNK